MTVPAHVRVTSPVTGIPSQFFFGRVRVGESSQQMVKIQFTTDAIPRSRSEVTFKHNLGDQLRLEWLKSNGEMWELQAVLTPTRSFDLSKAKVVVEFADTKLPRLELPIYAAFATKEENN